MTYNMEYIVRQLDIKMNTKLTLRLDETLISKAKAYAKRNRKSLSQIVAEYFNALAQKKNGKMDKPLGPITKQLFGALKGVEISEENYKRHLERKYL